MAPQDTRGKDPSLYAAKKEDITNPPTQEIFFLTKTFYFPTCELPLNFSGISNFEHSTYTIASG